MSGIASQFAIQYWLNCYASSICRANSCEASLLQLFFDTS